MSSQKIKPELRNKICNKGNCENGKIGESSLYLKGLRRKQFYKDTFIIHKRRIPISKTNFCVYPSKYRCSSRHDFMRPFNWAKSGIWGTEYFIQIRRLYSSHRFTHEKNAGKWSSQCLNTDQKGERVEASSSIWAHLEKYPEFLAMLLPWMKLV